MAPKKDWSKAWKGSWKPGELAYFEYHCEMSHTSGDAQMWYRTHQPVEVGRVYEPGGGGTREERAENAVPRSYWVTFLDGFRAVAIEDELLTDPKFWERRFQGPSSEEIEKAGGYKFD
jgi:hypothetical protein